MRARVLEWDASISDGTRTRTHDRPTGDVYRGPVLLQILAMEVMQDRRHEHAGVGFAEDIQPTGGQVRKYREEVTHERVQIPARLVLVGGFRPAVRESRPPRMLHIKHRRGARPCAFVDLEGGIGLETAIARGFQGLRDRRVLHHDAAIERGTARTWDRGRFARWRMGESRERKRKDV